MSFGNALQKILQDKGLRPANIVDENLSAKYLSKLLNGTMKSPTWDKALYIVDKLGMTPSEFRRIELEIESQADKRKAH